MDNKIYNLKNNGRVIGIRKSLPSIPMFTENNNKDNKFKDGALKGIQEDSVLSQIYFSKSNMNILQNQLRFFVFKNSNGKHIIDRQSDIDLEIIMRSIYLQHSLNLNCNIKEQIKKLNDLVIGWAGPRVLNEVEQYIGYINNVENMPVPMERPKNLSIKGSKSLRSVTSTF
tara:strand:- start:59 stop:571 length:513 start_codon:yes stop_codon:yes gene_type:complete